MEEIRRTRQYTYLINKIRSLIVGRTKPFLVALDGRSGVGKTTIARTIAEDIGGVVIIADDFFAGGKDSEWDEKNDEAKVADCIDWRRLRIEVLEPLLTGKSASWHPFNFALGTGLSEEVIQCKPASIIILDGAYSCRPELADLVDLSVLIEMSDDKLRRQRLLAREGHEFMASWHKRWDAAEDHYFTHVVPHSIFDLIITFE